MRITRYFFAFFLFLIAFIATGERYVYHVTYFDQSFFGITFSSESYSTSDAQFLRTERLAQDLEKYQFDIFYVERKYPSSLRAEITVYGTPGALQALRQLGIEEKTYRSLFVGEVQVIFCDFQALGAVKEDEVFCYIGTVGEAAAFKAQIAGESSESASYSVDEIDLVSGSNEGLHITLLFIWGTVFGLLLVLTLFSVVLEKKEIFVRLTLGESPRRLFAGRVLSDVAVFSAAFFGLAYLLRSMDYPFYRFSYLCGGFCTMLLLNTLLHRLAFRYGGEKVLGSGKEGRTALGVAYGVKAVSVCLTCAVFSVNVAVISEAAEYFDQNEFFSTLNNYSYYKLSLTTQTREEITDRHFEDKVWYQLDQAFGATAVYLVDQTDQIESNAVLINQNAVKRLEPYLTSDLVEQLRRATEEKLYIFFPPNFSEERIQEVLTIGKALFLRGREEEANLLSVSSYQNTERVLSISSNRYLNRSGFLENPVIFLDNTKHTGIGWYANPLYTAPDLLYQIPEEDFQVFLRETGMTDQLVTVTPAQELYDYYCESMERAAKLLSVVSMFLIVLEGIVTVFLVRIEYSVNGLEFAIKKTLGYGIFSRSRRLFLLPILLVALCTIGTACIEYMLHWGNPEIAVCVGVLIALAEMGGVVFQCLRFDRLKTQNVLKGGNL